MALIKCPECQNEISDTVSSCPQCGYKIKGSIDVENIKNKIIENKKILLIVLGIIVAIVIISNLFGSNESKDSKKLKEHLETIGYSCTTYTPKNSGDICDYCYYCTNTQGNGVNQTMKIDYRYDSTLYTETDNRTYEFHIQSSDYNSGAKHSGRATYVDKIEDNVLSFKPNARDYFVIGDRVNCDEYKSKVHKRICEDVVDDVNNSLRTFESYYTGAGIKLGK